MGKGPVGQIQSGNAVVKATSGGAGGFFDFLRRDKTAIGEAMSNKDDVPRDVTITEDHFLAPATGGRFAYLNDTVIHFAPEVRAQIGEAVHQVKEQLSSARNEISALKQQLAEASAKLGGK